MGRSWNRRTKSGFSIKTIASTRWAGSPFFKVWRVLCTLLTASSYIRIDFSHLELFCFLLFFSLTQTCSATEPLTDTPAGQTLLPDLWWTSPAPSTYPGMTKVRAEFGGTMREQKQFLFRFSPVVFLMVAGGIKCICHPLRNDVLIFFLTSQKVYLISQDYFFPHFYVFLTIH